MDVVEREDDRMPNEHGISKRSTDFLDDPFSFKPPEGRYCS